MRTLLHGLLLFVVLYLVLIGVGRVSEMRHGSGYLAVGALLLVLFGAIAWASGRPPRRNARRAPLDDMGQVGRDDHD